MREVALCKEEIPQDGLWVVRLVISAGFADSRKEARQLISRGLILLNGERALADSLCFETFFSKGGSIEYVGREKVLFILEE